MQAIRRTRLLALFLAGLTIAAVTTACDTAPDPAAGPPPEPTIGMLPTPVPPPTPEPAPTRQSHAAPPTTVSFSAAVITPVTNQRPIATTSFTIDNTLGRGMALRAAPRAVEIGKKWPDGTRVDGLGAEQDAAGWTWSWVRDPDGNAGWVPTNYLVQNESVGNARSIPPGVSAPSAPPTQIIVPTPVPPTPVPPTPIIETLTANGEPTADRAMPERTASERSGATTERISAAAPPKPTVAPSTLVKDTVVLSGRGDIRTKPFTLSGGDYTVAWQATPSGASANVRARMMPTTAAGGDTLVDTKIAGRERGETELYNVKGGPHYLDVSVAGDWIIAIVPQGQDATEALVAGLTAASPAPRVR